MILISLGSNLDSNWGKPAETIHRAFNEIEAMGMTILRRTEIFSTVPVKDSGGGDYSNALAEIHTHLPPKALLWRLKQIEHKAGRREARFATVIGKLPRWRARQLDLDLLCWHDLVCGPQDGKLRNGYVPLILPHPALYEREFISMLLQRLEET